MKVRAGLSAEPVQDAGARCGIQGHRPTRPWSGERVESAIPRRRDDVVPRARRTLRKTIVASVPDRRSTRGAISDPEDVSARAPKFRRGADCVGDSRSQRSSCMHGSLRAACLGDGGGGIVENLARAAGREPIEKARNSRGGRIACVLL